MAYPNPGPRIEDTSMTKAKPERRKHPRSRRGVPVAESEGGLLHRVDNISATSVLCHTSRAIPEMTRMSVALELPGAPKPVHAEGVVVRCEEESGHKESYRVAIVFTRVADSDQQAIRTYVERDLADA
jgi:hypothetical protein